MQTTRAYTAYYSKELKPMTDTERITALEYWLQQWRGISIILDYALTTNNLADRADADDRYSLLQTEYRAALNAGLYVKKMPDGL